MDEGEYIRRAFAAYYRSGRKMVSDDRFIDQPANSSEVRTHKRKHYVVLENVNGVLAVYRIKNDGMLRRMRRWPKEVE